MALIHSLLAAGIPFALFPASPTPYELKHLVKVCKVGKIFTSPRNLRNAQIVANEAGFSESDGIFILEGKVKGKRSFDDLVRSVKEPAKDYAKPVGGDALAYLIFSSGTTGLPKGGFIYFHKAYVHHFARAHHLELLGVMISHKNMMFSALQGFVTGALNKAVAPVSSSPEPDLTAYLTSFTGFVPAPTIPRHSGHIDPGAILPQLWVELVLFPRIFGSEYHRNHAKMGYEGRSEAYSKVRPSD